MGFFFNSLVPDNVGWRASQFSDAALVDFYLGTKEIPGSMDKYKYENTEIQMWMFCRPGRCLGCRPQWGCCKPSALAPHAHRCTGQSPGKYQMSNIDTIRYVFSKSISIFLRVLPGSGKYWYDKDMCFQSQYWYCTWQGHSRSMYCLSTTCRKRTWWWWTFEWSNDENGK